MKGIVGLWLYIYCFRWYRDVSATTLMVPERVQAS